MKEGKIRSSDRILKEELFGRKLKRKKDIGSRIKRPIDML